MLNKKGMQKIGKTLLISSIFLVLLIGVVYALEEELISMDKTDFKDKYYSDGIVLSKLIDEDTKLTEKLITTKYYPMEIDGEYYTLGAGTRITKNLFNDFYKLETLDGLVCDFLWDSPNALTVTDNKIDFNEGLLSEVTCNWDMKFIGGYTYLIGDKYYLDIDPSFYTTDETGENNWSSGTFYRTKSNTDNLSLDSNDGGNDAYTIILIHSNTTDGSTTFIDSSSYAHAIGVEGATHHEVDQQVFGTTSIEFDGDADYLTLTDSNDWTFGTEDYTFDFWVRWDDTPGNTIFYEYASNSTNFCSLNFVGDKLRMYCLEDDSYLANYNVDWSFSANTWYHLAFVRDGATGYIFVDGVNTLATESTAWGSNSMPDFNTEKIAGGIYSGGTFYVNGYMDEIRISRNIARWTSNFTLPSEPYLEDGYFTFGNYTSQVFDVGMNVNWTNIEWDSTLVNDPIDDNTKLLIHSDSFDGSKIFTDSSNSAHAISAEGDTHHEVDQKVFGKTSIQFDGTGDYLSIADSADWSFKNYDFAIDFWVNFTTFGTETYLYQQYTGSGYGLLIYKSNANLLRVLASSDGSSWGLIGVGDLQYDGLAVNTQYHIAVVRDGATMRLFVDGVEVDTADVSTTSIVETTSPVYIGTEGGSGNFFSGYIDELRVSNGTARWTSGFTPNSYPYAQVNNISIQTRTSDDSITWTDWSADKSNPSGAINGSARYLQYKSELEILEGSTTPFLNEVNITYEILDNAPAITEGSFTPTEAYTNNNLNCSARCYDSEYATPVLNLTLYKDNVLFNSSSIATNNTYHTLIVSSGDTTKDEVWTCNATCSDDYQTTTNSSIGTITILNSPPTWVIEPSNQTAVAGNETNYTISCTDADGETVSYSNDVTGTATSYYSLFNTTSGLFQFRPSYYEYLQSPIPINATCMNGVANISKVFWLEVTASVGGDSETCTLDPLIVSNNCHVFNVDSSTWVQPN